MRGGSWTAFIALGVLAWLAGCAPSTMSPMVMRLGPGQPDSAYFQAGLRGGPRLSAPFADGAEPSLFGGNERPFSTQQWSMAYDVALTEPLTERLSLHVGVQGEFFYPLPMPGYGVYAGLSTYFGNPRWGIAPAFVLRGASDLGIDSRGGPGTIVGAESSMALYLTPDPGVALGLVPFVGFHRVFSGEQSATASYYGAALAVQVPLDRLTRLEFSGGFGRAKTGGSDTWNAPIIGARWGR
ncbi:hypothetical protein [Stigmatella aurantiaca]|uniref:Conserved uncharacterized protein n=1 Tax=Stigmatella aurantiaca (strain DW4/3-1) TaxID=378806 RepID=E3G0B2_STIAD|nr:hypothetical protein [Stigmatella aurantiaca]ADO72505.1 conserved uncharacterized protein [Stigmatella aurantiaca DW4/3-1]